MRLAGSKLENETHLQPLSLFVPAAEFYAADLCVGCGVSVGAEMLFDGETGALLLILRRCPPNHSQSTPSFADVNGGAAMAGDAINEQVNDSRMVMESFVTRS